jgi:alkylated DNA repair dioxygenase AlkB
MLSLFPEETGYPEGFQYVPAFISPEEEAHYLDTIRTTELHAFIFQGFEARRRVASFGYDYRFDQGVLVKGRDIPEVFQPLIGKVASRLGIEAARFTELLITEYPPGSIITWHRDAPPFDLIAGISFQADCRFRLRPHAKEKQGRSATINLDVQRRSLYVMQGPSRSEWQHSIAPVKATRYSITLRTLKSC